MRRTRNLAKQSLFSLGMLGFVLLGTHLYGVNATVTQPAPALQQGTPTASFEVTNLADNGAGSLRQALLDANSMAGADTITFSVNGTINLEGSLPSINDNVMINGPGANLLTVRRNIGGTYRIFTVNAGVTATISGLTLTNGLQDNGGGILNTGTLTVNNCVITGNTAPDGGGGIFNRGTLTMNGCTISGP